MNHIETIELSISKKFSDTDYQMIKKKSKFIFEICKEINSKSINIKYKIILNLTKTLDYSTYNILKLFKFIIDNKILFKNNIVEFIFKITKNQDDLIKLIDKYYDLDITKKNIYV